MATHADHFINFPISSKGSADSASQVGANYQADSSMVSPIYKELSVLKASCSGESASQRVFLRFDMISSCGLRRSNLRSYSMMDFLYAFEMEDRKFAVAVVQDQESMENVPRRTVLLRLTEDQTVEELASLRCTGYFDQQIYNYSEATAAVLVNNHGTKIGPSCLYVAYNFENLNNSKSEGTICHFQLHPQTMKYDNHVSEKRAL